MTINEFGCQVNTVINIIHGAGLNPQGGVYISIFDIHDRTTTQSVWLSFKDARTFAHGILDRIG